MLCLIGRRIPHKNFMWTDFGWVYIPIYLPSLRPWLYSLYKSPVNVVVISDRATFVTAAPLNLRSLWENIYRRTNIRRRNLRLTMVISCRRLGLTPRRSARRWFVFLSRMLDLTLIIVRRTTGWSNDERRTMHANYIHASGPNTMTPVLEAFPSPGVPPSSISFHFTISPRSRGAAQRRRRSRPCFTSSRRFYYIRHPARRCIGLNLHKCPSGCR